jgi:hypothetical protein
MGQPPTCSAFPQAIPYEIQINEIDHRQPIEGDNGIQWKPYKKGIKHPLA